MHLSDARSFDDMTFLVHRDREDVDLYELFDADDDKPERRYACVAVCRKGDLGWPGFGGTRSESAPWGERSWESAREEARNLALAMDLKFTMIRWAEQSMGRKPTLFGFRGGKGLIWTPEIPGDNRGLPLTPSRLLAYGRLLQKLKGEFFGSTDVDVGNAQLRWIEQATSYTVGNRATWYMGEATAIGIRQGIHSTLKVLEVLAERLRQPLGNVDVLICGLGKVGFSLLRMLTEEGARVAIFDPALARTGVDSHFQASLRGGAQVTMRDRDLLARTDREHLVFRSETRALSWVFAGDDSDRRPIRIVCPATPRVKWLTESRPRQGPRYELLAKGRHRGPKIILGPANVQLDINEREVNRSALDALTSAGIILIPESVVNSGGVISGSHELALEWDEDVVRKDVEQVVDAGVRQLFRKAGRPTSKAIHDALLSIIKGHLGVTITASNPSSEIVSPST